MDRKLQRSRTMLHANRDIVWKVLWVVAAVVAIVGTHISIDAEEVALPKQAALAPEVDSLSAEGISLREKTYFYQAFNLRDPFASLLAGSFEESDELDVVDIYAVRLVGILSGENRRFAMLEDDNGYSYIVKAGDPVRNGNVVSVTDRSLVARVTVFGQTSTVTLRLEDSNRKGE